LNVENAFRNRMTHFRSCNPNLLVDPANFRKGWKAAIRSSRLNDASACVDGPELLLNREMTDTSAFTV
jgi:hypothetical protein